MIILFQSDTKIAEWYFQQLVHVNLLWVYNNLRRSKLYVCFSFFEDVVRTVHPSLLHFETFIWICFDSMSSRGIYVSSGGIGGYLNHFIEESSFWPAPFSLPPF